ncbi:MAG: GFA family protein [Acidimicrobiales bacterium]
MERTLRQCQTAPTTGTADAVVANGSCMCGGVRFHVMGPFRNVLPCHCVRCRAGAIWYGDQATEYAALNPTPPHVNAADF